MKAAGRGFALSRRFVVTVALVSAGLTACGSSSDEPEAAADAAEAEAPTQLGEQSVRPAVTVEGFAACSSRAAFERMMSHIARGESESYRGMLENIESGCIPVKAGVSVEVTRVGPTFVEYRPVGAETTVWSVVEAVEFTDLDSGGNSSSDSAQVRENAA